LEEVERIKGKGTEQFQKRMSWGGKDVHVSGGRERPGMYKVTTNPATRPGTWERTLKGTLTGGKKGRGVGRGVEKNEMWKNKNGGE